MAVTGMPGILNGLLLILRLVAPNLAAAIEKAYEDGVVKATEIDELIVELADAVKTYVPKANINEVEFVQDLARAVGKYEDSQAEEAKLALPKPPEPPAEPKDEL